MRIEPDDLNTSSHKSDHKTIRDESVPSNESGHSERRDDEPLYVISVAAKLVNVPIWTLRVLDEQGIVTPKRTDKNRRLYSDKDLLRLARVRLLSEEEGVNMNGVRLILKLEEERELSMGE